MIQKTIYRIMYKKYTIGLNMNAKVTLYSEKRVNREDEKICKRSQYFPFQNCEFIL